MDASVEDAVERTRSRLPRGESLLEREECGAEIPASQRTCADSAGNRTGPFLGANMAEFGPWRG